MASVRHAGQRLGVDRGLVRFLPTERQIAPWGPPRGEQRTLRGGCWFYFAESVRAACRHHYMPDYRYSYVGFRVVCSSTRSV